MHRGANFRIRGAGWCGCSTTACGGARTAAWSDANEQAVSNASGGYTSVMSDSTDAQRPKRTVTVRVGRLGIDDERMDDEWWESFTADERVAMMWDLVLEARRWRGEVGDEPRLQRSVVRVERR